MLSNHSFNALLKTLEEPPAHVKFILATTDPQKLPMTVLSRCLQFHLWRLPIKKIVGHLAVVLQKEGIAFEEDALMELARAADGSLRDALSLLDQAINYSDGELKAVAIRLMLGVSERAGLFALLQHLAIGDGATALREVRAIAESAPDFSNLLAQFLELLYQIAVAQKIPTALDETAKGRKEILRLAGVLSAEEIQLYYQIGLNGQRDLPFAPTPQIGFEMIVLRMVAFQPVRILDSMETIPVVEEKIAIEEKIVVEKITTEKKIENPVNSAAELSNPGEWTKLIGKLNLNGLTKLLAEHCVVAESTVDSIRLILDDTQKILFNKRYEERLQEALSEYFGQKMALKIVEGKVVGETPAIQNKREMAKAYESTCQTVEVDSKIQKLIQAFDAKIEKVVANEL
jgi:DNA polymerase-3 subunit gamma/tau